MIAGKNGEVRAASRSPSRRTPAERGDLPQQVDVVTPTDLQRTPGDDVADALKRNASVDIIQFPGLLSGVSVRGFRPQYSGLNPRTLLLIDGRPAGEIARRTDPESRDNARPNWYSSVASGRCRRYPCGAMKP